MWRKPEIFIFNFLCVCVLGEAFRSVAIISWSPSLVRVHLLHRRHTPQQRAACSRSSPASVQPPCRQYPQQRFQQSTVTSMPNLHRRDQKLISGGHASEQEGKKVDELKKTGSQKKREKDFEWCLSLLICFLVVSFTDSVPVQLTPAVLLKMGNFNSIPSGCDHSTAELVKVKGVRSIGSPLFCLFHNNNGVRKQSNPRSFWGWHIWLRYCPSASLSPFSPSPSYSTVAFFPVQSLTSP